MCEVTTIGRARRAFVRAAIGAWLVIPMSTEAQASDSTLVEFRIAQSLCDRRVVVLGELPSHGEARAFGAKARIVQHLVTRCGFRAVLFEAPIYDFLGLEQAIAERSAQPLQLDRAIGGFWWTRELAEWRRWLFDGAAQGTLVLGGIDDQPSATSHYARAVLPALVAGASPAQRAAECEAAIARYLHWRYDSVNTYGTAEQERLRSCTDAAAIGGNSGGSRTPNAFQQAMLANLSSHFARERTSRRFPDRDSVMFRNIRWYEARLPEDARYVVWSSTVHAARRQGELARKPLGAWLADVWGDRLAVIGFGAFTGRSSMAGRGSTPIPAAPVGSLEALTTDATSPHRFLDRSALRQLGRVPSSLFGRSTTADWSSYFDGVLVFREEVPPTFEARR